MAPANSGKRKANTPLLQGQRDIRGQQRYDSNQTLPELTRVGRDLFVRERQNEIERVLDAHDTFVRENFHLQKFVSLLTFDPEIAKLDDSPVFQEYKASYDLVAQAQTCATSQRSTRRAHTKRLQLLKGDPNQRSLFLRDDKPQIKTLSAPSHNIDLWNLLAAAKGKNKEKVDSSGLVDRTSAIDLAPFPVPRRKPKRMKYSPTGHLHENLLLTPGTSPASSQATVPHVPFKRRRTESTSTRGSVFLQSSDRVRKRISNRRRPRANQSAAQNQKTRDLPLCNSTPDEHSNALVPTSSFRTIKRVRLLVRPPPPSFSHPQQRPPPQRHGGSLTMFLTSYITIDDRETVALSNLENAARTDALLLERIYRFRKAGRLFLTQGSMPPIAGCHANHSAAHFDAWGHIVHAVVTRVKGKKVDGRNITSQIAAKIRAYWDRLATKEDRAKAAEEKRLRVLAKNTVRLVVAEWKKALFHIRERERLRVQAEEVRKGHEHLDAILDQSGMILETQQVDLAKAALSKNQGQGETVTSSGANDPLNGVGSVEVGQEEYENSEQSEANDDFPHEDMVPLEDNVSEDAIPEYLRPFAVTPIEWNPDTNVQQPLLLRGILRPYQQAGLEWLASLHTNNLNGILADEMGLGKTIQTIALLAHLACDRGIWGPHLIVVPTSVLLNWEMEFKKFLPGFKVLCYHGNTKRRKELRQGWNDKHHFNVCITSYALASRDAHIFKRKAWYYFILDEAHMIKNFKSQRWNILLTFRSFRRLLLTGTPLQNNLTELWALLQFLMSGTNFANLKEFGEWFSNPLEKAIEMGAALENETLQRVSKLHTVLRPYLLRRLKRDVEKELPSKYEHLVLCPLSKRQRFLYDEFMSRAQTQDALQSGIYHKIANILMQLRKVCNHPNLFEVRPIVTSFAMDRSAIADFEIKELLVRRRFFDMAESPVGDTFNLRFSEHENTSVFAAMERRRLDASLLFPISTHSIDDLPPKDMHTISGFRRYMAHQLRTEMRARWGHIAYLNRHRCSRSPIYSQEVITIAQRLWTPLYPRDAVAPLQTGAPSLLAPAVKSFASRALEMADIIDKFTFITPTVVALDLPRIALRSVQAPVQDMAHDLSFDEALHRSSVRRQIAFPDSSLLQYDCGKLQELAMLLREKKSGGHRVLVFTQMTKVLDILEVFLNFHGYLYLRLDGATKIEDRQYVTERFNTDTRIFCFIASSRSGGVGINLTGADTVIFYDSDFNPQMDRQCEDRAHRIGQIRDVHIYRFISQHTVEEAMLLKANQKRFLDDLVIQKGEFDWRSLFRDESALTKALGEFEDREDAHAAALAAREEVVMEGVDDADFGDELAAGDDGAGRRAMTAPMSTALGPGEEVAARDEVAVEHDDGGEGQNEEGGDDDSDGGTTVDYMLSFVLFDYDFFRDWRL